MILPYQKCWLDDTAPVKVWQKSRQIGASWIQAYEDVRDCATGATPAVWYSSADETAAASYINYCREWIKEFGLFCELLDAPLTTKDDDITIFRAIFRNGSAINALSSNPKNYRSKRGKVVLDEFAFHKDAIELWNAAKPVTTWGFPVRIISSHYHVDTLFCQFIAAIQTGSLNWSLHTTTIDDAIADGLVDKILQREATDLNKVQWRQKVHDECFSESTFLREYMCIPDATSNRLFNNEELYQSMVDAPATCKPQWLGVDVGRFHDPTVLWLTGRIANTTYTHSVESLRDTPLDTVERRIVELIHKYKLSGVAIDSTGLGIGLCDNLRSRFGSLIIPYSFTQASKELLAFNLRDQISTMKNFKIPRSGNFDKVFLSVKVNNLTTRTSITNDDTTGNADSFWACALSAYAASVKSVSSTAFQATTRRVEAHKALV